MINFTSIDFTNYKEEREMKIISKAKVITTNACTFSCGIYKAIEIK